MKRLVIFSEDFPPYSGGIAQWAAGMADAFTQMGLEVTIFTRVRAAYPVDRHQYRFDIQGIQGSHWRQLRSWYCHRAMRKFLQKQRVDAIIATTWNVARGIVPLADKYRIPLFTVVHGLEVTRPMPALKVHWMKHTLFSSSRVIAVSRFTKDQVIRRCRIPESRIQVLPNGVDIIRYAPGRDVAPLRKRLGLKDERIILTLARVIERKGHEQVIRALPRILQAVPNAHYIIAGPWEDRYYDHLQRLIQQSGLTRHVHFTGYLESEALANYYHLCDVYVMLSLDTESSGDTEGFGITYLEANACEKPVVAGRTGGVADAVIDGETGILIDSADIQAVESAIIRLLEDENLAGKLGKQGRERIVRELTWNRIARQLVELIFPDGN